MLSYWLLRFPGHWWLLVPLWRRFIGRPILRPAKEPPLPQIQHPAGHPPPAFTTGYEGTSFSFNAGYGFDAELYPDERTELTDPFARQRATIGLGYAMTRTASPSFDVSYTTSNRPSDLVEDTGLELGRRNSQS